MGEAITRAEAEERAECGAALLDADDVNWVFKPGVNTDTLIMSYAANCVLTQVYGNYATGLQVLGMTLETEDDIYTTEHDVVKNGFDLAHAEAHDDECNIDVSGRESYRVLTNAWRNLIVERQNRGLVPAQVSP